MVIKQIEARAAEKPWQTTLRQTEESLVTFMMRTSLLGFEDHWKMRPLQAASNARGPSDTHCSGRTRSAIFVAAPTP